MFLYLPWGAEHSDWTWSYCTGDKIRAHIVKHYITQAAKSYRHLLATDWISSSVQGVQGFWEVVLCPYKPQMAWDASPKYKFIRIFTFFQSVISTYLENQSLPMLPKLPLPHDGGQEMAAHTVVMQLAVVCCYFLSHCANRGDCLDFLSAATRSQQGAAKRIDGGPHLFHLLSLCMRTAEMNIHSSLCLSVYSALLSLDYSLIAKPKQEGGV